MVQADIAGDHLHVSAELPRFPIALGDINGVGDILKTEINTRFEPFVHIADRGRAHESVRESEIILPPQVIRIKMLQIPVRRLAQCVCPRGNEERVVTGHELGL